MILFNRQTKLRVFTDSQSIDIEDLNVGFSISAHRRRTPNKGQFQVYNLAEDTAHLIEQEAQYLEFFAGYSSAPLGRIHKGFVDTSTTLLMGTERITTISSVDSGETKQYTLASITETFGEGTPVKDVFSKFASVLNMPVTLDYVGTDVLLSSETYMGPLRNALDELASDYGYDWSIQFGVLEVVKKGEAPNKDSQALILTKENIIDIPEVTNRGLKLKTLILPGLIPSRLLTVPGNIQSTTGRKVKKSLKERGIGGTYITDSIDYTGERDGKKYEAVIDAWRQL